MTAEQFRHAFELDGFQVEAGEAIGVGQNVLVSAPTGSGKTVVAELAISEALRSGTRCFYTAPIKALSNQKFNDLSASMGSDRVGLLTGDHSINADAPVVVMTTEVLRNMVYGHSDALVDLGWVVLDEVHFLSDAYRGPVWEEVIIHTPPSVRFVCLSATVSNAEELGEWITSLRGPTRTVVEHQRPVQLDSMLMVGDRLTDDEYLVPLLSGGRANPEGRRFDAEKAQYGQGRRGRSRFFTPRRTEVVERLRDEDLLPAIYFIFSRNACDEAAQRCFAAGLRLTNTEERTRIREIIESCTEALSDADLGVLNFDHWREVIESGIAAHHAGMVPPFREAVELCFVEGLIKVVFATETLAMGINMPARSVVIEKLSKFNGEAHEPLSASLYTQLTGRAGRRGIDTHGHAVVLWSPFSTFDQVATLAASRDFNLESSFRPNYNMAANLVDRYDRDEAFEVLGLSFAQFQADRVVHGLRVERERLRRQLDEEPQIGSDASGASPVFDVAGYLSILESIEEQKRQRRRQRFDTDRFLGTLKPGDVLSREPVGQQDLNAGIQRCVVISVSHRRGGAVRVTAVDASGQRVQITHDTDWAFSDLAGKIDLPVPYTPKDRGFRKEAARRLNRMNTRRTKGRSQHGRVASRHASPQGGALSTDLRSQLRSHPLHDHPDRESMLEAERSRKKSLRRLEHLDSRIERTGLTLSGRLEAILEVLDETDHLDGWSLNQAGNRLRRIFNESDLLISMTLGSGLLDGLDPPELAALVSCFTYEHRSSTPAPEPVIPTLALRERFPALLGLWKDLSKLEGSTRTTPTREPQGGFMAAAWSWASGHDLDLIIDEDLSGGDFVRNVRTLVDVLEQIANVATSDTTATAASAAGEALRRGVILTVGGPR